MVSVRETTFERGKTCIIRLMPANGHRGGDIEVRADTVKEQVRAGKKVCTFMYKDELVGRFDNVDNWWVKYGPQGRPAHPTPDQEAAPTPS